MFKSEDQTALSVICLQKRLLPAVKRLSEMLPSTRILCKPRTWFVPGLPLHMDSSCPASHPSAPPTPSGQGCSQSLHSPAWMDTGGCPKPGAAPAPGLVKPGEISMSYFSSWSRSLWMAPSFRGINSIIQLGVISRFTYIKLPSPSNYGPLKR